VADSGRHTACARRVHGARVRGRNPALRRPPQAGPGAGAVFDEVRATQARAEKYWNAETSPDFPELLIVGSVEVVELIHDK